MDRNPAHPFDASARLPVRQKEVKFDTLCVNSDDRFAEGTSVKSEERRGFRPATKLLAPNVVRMRGRAGGGSETGLSESSLIVQEMPGEDKTSQGPRPRGRQLRTSESTTDATPIARGKGKSGGVRPGHAAPSTVLSTRNLWVEGSSVLNQDVCLASAALSHLSDCVALERRLKAEWEAARLAKIRALRAVVKMFMQSLIDPGPYTRPANLNGRVSSETLAVARFSVVTNALVGTVQNFMRACYSQRLCAARCAVLGRHLPPTVARGGSAGFAVSLYSSGLDGTGLSVEDSYLSSTRSIGDRLEEEEVSRIKQLYFDYFDCEAMSISSAVLSEGDTSLLAYGATSTSQPSSTPLRGDLDSFSHCASKTM
ncbi:hypothetical protein JKF63_01509 [Porcisia hertigi]|uniref:Uncharacterized protein n=1 Tax=Porcisia hertigi TaxID=2761500 RepID=A0A836HHS6_9TRYP|nr:hypothetical protein JKF63_01509 [Porcisia hertigi]